MSHLLDRLLNWLARLGNPIPAPQPIPVRDTPALPLTESDIEALSRYRLASLMQYPHY